MQCTINYTEIDTEIDHVALVLNNCKLDPTMRPQELTMKQMEMLVQHIYMNLGKRSIKIFVTVLKA